MNTNETINRMKAMMTYGLQTESKAPYSSVEFQKLGADKKMYGIVREGTKYYVKVAPNKANLIKEDFEYIGGFRNRKNNEYSSYANALKQFDLKMMSIKESVNNRDIIAESWNPEAYAQLTEESTKKLRGEINRQRQIMQNASLISEGKECSCCCGNCNCEQPKVGDAKEKGAPFNAGVESTDDMENPDTIEKNNINGKNKPVVGNKKGKTMKESSEVLGWNDNEDYLDTSHGTQIGDGAPFNKPVNTQAEMDNGVVEEGVAITDEDETVNSPKPGTGKVQTSDGNPFTKVVKEAVEDGEETLDDNEDEFDVEGDDDFDAEDDTDFGDEDNDFDAEDDTDFDAEDDTDFGDEDDDTEYEAEFDFEDPSTNYDDEDNDIEARLSSLENLINKIADKLGVGEFDDDELYDDEDGETEFEITDDDEDDDFDDVDDADDVDTDDEDFDYDDFEDDNTEDDTDDDTDEDDDDDDDTQVFESRSYRRAKALREDEMKYFGKHPAWRKKVMTLPDNNEPNTKDGYYTMDDEESVSNEKPYGIKVGSSAPFTINPSKIENAIAESIDRFLKKK